MIAARISKRRRQAERAARAERARLLAEFDALLAGPTVEQIAYWPWRYVTPGGKP